MIHVFYAKAEDVQEYFDESPVRHSPHCEQYRKKEFRTP